MSNGPFRDDINGELIPRFIMEELFPCLEKINGLCLRALAIDSGLVNSLYRKDINEMVEIYRATSQHFLDLYIKWNTPDLFYAELDKKISDNMPRMGGILQEYHNYGNVMQPHFDQGFRLLEQTDRSIAALNNASFARLSLLTSTLALIVSVAAIIIAMMIKEG